MKDSGPPLAPLLRRLADTPAEWMLPATTAAAEGVSSAALLSDFLEDLGLIPLNEKEVSAFDGAKADQRGWLALVLLALWLLHGDQLKAELSQRASPELRRSLLNLLGQPLRDRASVLNAQSAVRTTPGREEFARQLLAALGLRPEGETLAQAKARLEASDSIERARLVEAANAAQERARKLREAMARKAAQEAAMKYNRE